jgi:GalNAc-alpha-(1->4)-GalNAc-alpha-(1->3)-diNAcBac-PP-undecaprenol alpha-1,4-N-acetyl-D-galactosaminyltransferase
VITILDGPGDAYELDSRVSRYRCGFAKDKSVNPASDKQARSGASVRNAQRKRVTGVLRRFQLMRPVFSAMTFGSALHGRARWLRRTLKQIQPDAVLSFLTQTNILTILATRGLGIRTVVSERNDPRLQKHRKHVELLRNAAYRWADCVTANSHGAVGAMADFVPAEKLAFLPNPLSVRDDGEVVEFDAPTFITVTRLVEQKGLDVLLRACAKAFRILPSWRLAIVGDGPLRDELESLAAQLGIADRIAWMGHVKDPAPYLRAAEFFVLTSRFEGSPNALLEAMAVGLPAVVSDASPGPIELIGGAAAGLVVPVEDVDATAAAILKLAQDADLRGRLGEAAKAMTSGHQLDNAMQTWLNILYRC